MNDRVDEACYHSLSDDPDQPSLDSFGVDTKETRIAVVRAPNDTGILDVVDEWEQALGMPEDALEKFWKWRAAYRSNDAVDHPSDRAYDELELDEVYLEHLRSSPEAQRALDDIVRRVESGERVVLVCFEEPHKRCHRHILANVIEARLSDDKFTFTSTSVLQT